MAETVSLLSSAANECGGSVDFIIDNPFTSSHPGAERFRHSYFVPSADLYRFTEQPPCLCELFEETYYVDRVNSSREWYRSHRRSDADLTIEVFEQTTCVEGIVEGWRATCARIPDSFEKKISYLVLVIHWERFALEVAKYGADQYYVIATHVQPDFAASLSLKAAASKVKMALGVFKMHTRLWFDSVELTDPSSAVTETFPAQIRCALVKAMPRVTSKQGAWMALRLPEFIGNEDACLQLFQLRKSKPEDELCM